MEIFVREVKKINLTNIPQADSAAKKAVASLIVRTLPQELTGIKNLAKKAITNPAIHWKNLNETQQNALHAHVKKQEDAARAKLLAILPSTPDKTTTHIVDGKEVKTTLVSPSNNLLRGKAMDAFRRIKSLIEIEKHHAKEGRTK